MFNCIWVSIVVLFRNNLPIVFFFSLERNWNIRIPGFAADDIRPLRKPTIPSSHQSKVQAVNAAKSQISNTSAKKDNSHN